MISQDNTVYNYLDQLIQSITIKIWEDNFNNLIVTIMEGDLNIRFLQSNGIQEEPAKQEISWKMRRDRAESTACIHTHCTIKAMKLVEDNCMLTINYLKRGVR